MYNRTRCTLVTSVKSSALAAIREVLKKVLKKVQTIKTAYFLRKSKNIYTENRRFFLI